MIVTQEEAKKKWCPMVRFHVVPEDPYVFDNKLFDGADNSASEYSTKCIASECMMWRCDITRKEAQNGFHSQKGYCGLGGKP